MSVLPTVQSFLLADSVFQQKTGKWCVIGIFDRILGKSFPLLHHSLGLYLEVSGIPAGEHTLHMVLLNSEQKALAISPKVRVRCKHRMVTKKLGIGMQTNHLLVPEPGVYFIKVMFDNEPLVSDIRLEAQKIPGEA